jgi:hypothetical protein
MSLMYTRNLIDLFYPRSTSQTESLPNAGTSADAEFDWPPSAEDLAAFSIVELRADDESEIEVAIADVA